MTVMKRKLFAVASALFLIFCAPLSGEEELEEEIIEELIEDEAFLELLKTAVVPELHPLGEENSSTTPEHTLLFLKKKLQSPR